MMSDTCAQYCLRKGTDQNTEIEIVKNKIQSS